jgi:hypothetical protein
MGISLMFSRSLAESFRRAKGVRSQERQQNLATKFSEQRVHAWREISSATLLHFWLTAVVNSRLAAL